MTGFKDYRMKYGPLMDLLSKLSRVVYIEFLKSEQVGEWLLHIRLLSGCTYTHTHNRPGGQKMCIININL